MVTDSPAGQLHFAKMISQFVSFMATSIDLIPFFIVALHFPLL